MNFKIFNRHSVFSIAVLIASWSQISHGLDQDLSKRFVYLANSATGSVGVCEVNAEIFKNCRDITRVPSIYYSGHVYFKGATDIAFYKNSLYVTDYENHLVNIYRMNIENGNLSSKMQVIGLSNPRSIDFISNKIVISNYGSALCCSYISIYNLFGRYDENGKEQYDIQWLPIFLPRYNTEFNIYGTSYNHSVKFYTRNNSTVAYVSRYTWDYNYQYPGNYSHAMIFCRISENISFNSCFLLPIDNAAEKFTYPEKIFIHNNVLYTTNYGNEKFTYSQINSNFSLKNVGFVKFNDDFKVNYADFQENFVYLASAGRKIRKCEILSDGGISADCNTSIDFTGTPLEGKEYDLIKFVDIDLS